MSFINFNWISLLDSITENSQPQLRLLDTIIFDNFNTLRPIFWVFTNEEGRLQKNNLREWTTPEIIDNILHVYNKNPNTLIFKVSQSGNREVILNPKHENLISHSLKSVQIFNCNIKLKPELIVHSFSDMSEEKVYISENSTETLIEMTNPINHRVKAMSRLFLFTFKKVLSYPIKSVKFLYYVDSHYNDPWLAWVSDIIIEKPEILKPATRNISRSFSRLPTSELKREWRTFDKGTPIIRGRNIRIVLEKNKPSKSVEKVDVEIQNTLHPGLDESFNFLPTLQKFYRVGCRGQFCNMESIKMPKYDLDLRCLVPIYLVEMAQKSGNSPYINSNLRKIPREFKRDLDFRPFNKKFHFSKQVPVCLKCYIVYYNIKNKEKLN